MGKRRRASAWRRFRGAYRIGDDKPADPNQELQRLTLYVTGTTLDHAETQALQAGFETVQDFCAQLIQTTVDAEHVRGQVASVEARHGPLTGLNAIADDPEFLAELSGAATSRAESVEPAGEPPTVRLATPPPAVATGATVAGRVVLRHAGQGDEETSGFLATLRRGGPLAAEPVHELLAALAELEQEARGVAALDRALAFALHRLAFEAQVLHTDAYPGAFDVWTVNAVRAVQEAVERIVSGQDIRYDRPAEPPR